MASRCSNCGMQLSDNVTICSHCDHPITSGVETAQIESQQPLKSETPITPSTPLSSPTPSQTTDQNTQVGQLILSRVGEFLHKPHYNVRTAAQSYSNIGAVLAGFAFAAMILVMQNTQLPQKLPDAALLRDWATIVFLIALFGCILSAFAFSVVSGEEILAPRTNMIALFGGVGFSISASLIFWSLVTLTKIFLDSNIVTLARLLYPLFALIQPAYLAFSALDNVYLFEDKSPTQKE
jgi:hypothetical protein